MDDLPAICLYLDVKECGVSPVQTAPTTALAKYLISSFISAEGIHAAAEHLLNATVIQQSPPQAIIICIGSQVVPLLVEL
jgi:hypothetical protein